MKNTTNPELELAYKYVQQTNQNIFLTGKAGTGKTTFLHRIKQEAIKRMAVVAPTGVAAINARGMTIHSFFQLPFGPNLPDQKAARAGNRQINKKKIKIFQALDLLIIDEISMVRSDTLDAIDEVLRQYKNRLLPFGGVQLLMIGDLHQLPPVVRDNEWQLLRQHYETPYFFGSHALRETGVIPIQLKHIYRQSDSIFIDLLNKVRDNQLNDEVLETLNSRYIPDFTPKEEEGYITLTSHNRTADEINEEKLRQLKGKSRFFKCKIEDKFPENAYPNAETLEFKVGAQVMFIKNDTSQDKLFYNGKIGRIIEMKSDEIKVQCEGDDFPITVTPTEWENIKYEVNAKTNEMEEQMLGKFVQYPLKLAWAITIHKSQGLTFEKAIIDAAAAFAHGQVYVALSRCKTFEGIVLRSKIGFGSVRTDQVIQSYTQNAEENAPSEDDLKAARREFQAKLIAQLFDFTLIDRQAKHVQRLFLEQERTLTTEATQQYMNWLAGMVEIIDFGNRFQPVLQTYFRQEELPQDNIALQERIHKASAYFLEKLKVNLMPALLKIPIVTENKEIKKRAQDRIGELYKLLFSKMSCFEKTKDKFDPDEYLKIKANADLKAEQVLKKEMGRQLTKITVPNGVEHAELFKELVNWRIDTADDEGKTPYEVLTLEVIKQLTIQLPTSSKRLLAIKGIGKVKVAQYGDEIIRMIDDFCIENNITPPAFVPKEKQKRKPKLTDTKKASLDLFQKGLTIAQIAKARELTEGTIKGHLAFFVEEGTINVHQLITADAVAEIMAVMKEKPDGNRSDLFQHFNGRYSYADLKIVYSHTEYLKTKG